MPAPAEIIQLVELFQRNYDQYRDPAFSETAVRHDRDLINLLTAWR